MCGGSRALTCRSPDKREEEDAEERRQQAGTVADVVSGVVVEEFMMISSSVPMEIGMATVPGRMAVTGVRLLGSAGMVVGKMYCRKALQGLTGQSSLGVVRSIGQSTILAGALEAQAARQVIIRIPVFGRSFVERFMQGLGSSELEAIAASQLSNTVRLVGVQGRLLVIVASLLVHEAVEFTWLLANGSATGLREFVVRTAQHMLAALGSLGGGMVGTAMGALALPGVGTGVGSLAGSLIGASLADLAWTAARDNMQREDQGQGVLEGRAGDATGCIELHLGPRDEDPRPPDFVGPLPPPGDVRIECPDLDDDTLRALQNAQGDAPPATSSTLDDDLDEFTLIDAADAQSDSDEE